VISVRSRFLIPGLSATVMLVVLAGLGTWQVYRLHWKQGILVQIATAESAPPIPLGPDPAPYTKVSAVGHFRFDLAVQYGVEVRDTLAGPTMGSYQIVPLQRVGAPTVLVNRGWVPQKREVALNDPAGEVTVIGYVRPGDKPQWFSAADNVAIRQFYTLDPQGMARSLGVDDSLPFILVALGSEPARSYPVPAQHLPRPPNNHLSYVLTWYGLALALVVVFAVWARKVRTQ
jgi:surfeit locus 1 family protein